MTSRHATAWETEASASAPAPADLGPGVFPYRVFGVGFNKTGTSSLHRALRRLGVVPVASQAVVNRTKITDALFERGDYEPALRFARMYRAFEDRPWNVWEMYRRLDQRYPGSRFILTVREPDDWWRSLERWITVSKPGATERYRQHLRSASLSRADMTRAYLRYNQEVREYFAGRGDFLELDLVGGAGWEPLCGFLDLPVPDRSFPHVNRQSYDLRDLHLVRTRRRARRGELKRKGVEVLLGSHHCVRCGEPLPVDDSGIPGLVERFAGWSKEAYRRLQRRVFVPARDRRDAEARAAALRSDHPGLTLDDVAVVACFFNPSAYRSRRVNYRRFRESLAASGLPLLTVELAIGDDPFVLDAEAGAGSGSGSDRGEILRVRSPHAMWQKERLLNLGIRRLLDQGYRKIVWLDADVVFEDAEHWPWHVAAELERSAVCQVFGQVLVEQEGGRVRLPGVAAVRYHRETGGWLYQDRRGPTWRRPVGYPLGYSGYGWAARAEVLERVELYDRAVVGGGDKLIYAASTGLAGDWRRRLAKLLETSRPQCATCGHSNEAPAYVEDCLAWAERWDRAVEGRAGWTDQTIVALFHGDRRDRRYTSRREILLRHGFDPATDLVEDEGGCWRWATAKPDLHLEVQNYFFERREDD